MSKTKTAEAKAEALQEKIAAATEAANLDPGKIAFVKDLRKQLGEHLADGAETCKNCGHEVVGMLKTPSYFDPRAGVQMPAVYEVGCVVCPPVYVASDKDHAIEAKLDGKKAKVVRRSYSARGTSIEEARDNWNAGNFVEDTKFGLNVAPDEHKRLGLVPDEAKK